MSIIGWSSDVCSSDLFASPSPARASPAGQSRRPQAAASPKGVRKMEATTDQIATIAALNDIARRTMGVTCRTVITQGIAALDENTQSDILKMIVSADGRRR